MHRHRRQRRAEGLHAQQRRRPFRARRQRRRPRQRVLRRRRRPTAQRSIHPPRRHVGVRRGDDSVQRFSQATALGPHVQHRQRQHLPPRRALGQFEQARGRPPRVEHHGHRLRRAPRRHRVRARPNAQRGLGGDDSSHALEPFRGGHRADRIPARQGRDGGHPQPHAFGGSARPRERVGRRRLEPQRQRQRLALRVPVQRRHGVHHRLRGPIQPAGGDLPQRAIAAGARQRTLPVARERRVAVNGQGRLGGLARRCRLRPRTRQSPDDGGRGCDAHQQGSQHGPRSLERQGASRTSQVCGEHGVYDIFVRGAALWQ